MTGNDIKLCLAMPVKHAIILVVGGEVAGDGLRVGRKYYSKILKLLAFKTWQNLSLIVCLK